MSLVLSLVGQLLLPVMVALSLTCVVAWLLLAVFLALPYVFSGITVSLALTQSPSPVSRVYGVDMAGAAAGCLAVVGAGGGRDVLSAWVFGRRDITGLELNPILVDLVTRHPELSRIAGLADLPSVRFLAARARNWFSRNPETFDIIHMSLAGDKRANAAGGFTTAENGIYTVEAWRTFLSRLTPEGVFSVSRWYSPGEVDEFSRLLSLAVAALLERGVRDPGEHLFAVSAGKIATLLITASPWTARDLAALEQAVRDYDYRLLLHPHHRPASPRWQDLLGAESRQALEEVSRTFLQDVRPPTDDRPFFFNHLPFHRPGAWLPLAPQIKPGGPCWGISWRPSLSFWSWRSPSSC